MALGHGELVVLEVLLAEVGPLLEDDDGEPIPRELARDDGARGAAADDREVHLLRGGEPDPRRLPNGTAHEWRLGRSCAMTSGRS